MTTTRILRQGNVVKIPDHEDLLWVVNNGFYTIDETVLFGWYLYQVNGYSIIPFTSDLQDDATLVTYNPYSQFSEPYPIPQLDCSLNSYLSHCTTLRKYSPSV